jgi:hypothetical protein
LQCYLLKGMARQVQTFLLSFGLLFYWTAVGLKQSGDVHLFGTCFWQFIKGVYAFMYVLHSIIHS